MPFGFINPEFHTFESDVVVWAVESPLVQTTVVPTDTFTGLGAKAVVVNTDAPGGIRTLDVGPDGVGVGVGVGVVGVVGTAAGDEDEPHEAARKDVRTIATR